MQFNYKATTKEGRPVSGTAEVADRLALLSLLHKQGLHPVLLEEAKGKSKGKSLFKSRQKVKLGDLVIFTRQLSTMVSAGVPLTKALSSLGENAENPYLKQVLKDVTKDVEGGIPLGE